MVEINIHTTLKRWRQQEDVSKMQWNKRGKIVYSRDFNWRIGERGARNWEEQRGDGKRKFKDKMENGEGKRLMKWIEKNGWEAFNGNKQGDEGSWEKWW
jgi:hypothetical protein